LAGSLDESTHTPPQIRCGTGQVGPPVLEVEVDVEVDELVDPEVPAPAPAGLVVPPPFAKKSPPDTPGHPDTTSATNPDARTPKNAPSFIPTSPSPTPSG
jgi:hypothetical protein